MPQLLPERSPLTPAVQPVRADAACRPAQPGRRTAVPGVRTTAAAHLHRLRPSATGTCTHPNRTGVRGLLPQGSPGTAALRPLRRNRIDRGPRQRRPTGHLPELLEHRIWQKAASGPATETTAGTTGPGNPPTGATTEASTIRDLLSVRQGTEGHGELADRPGLRVLLHQVREHPAACTGCSEIRVLIAKDADGQLVCGPCSGSPLDYRCRQCGNAGRVIAAGKCYRCCVELRLHELLDGADGQIPVELTALAKAMLAAEKPRSVWVWLNRSAAAPLLELIAHQPGPPTHAILDALTPSRAVHFVRRMLIDTEVLPDRMDHLDRVDPWLDSVLETRPPAHARLVRPYAKWHLLHRGRRRANRRGDSPGSAYSLRETIHVTLDLLDWIDRRGLMLVSLNQGDVDTWLVETPGSRPYFARDFLQWAVSNRLAPKGITIPARKVGEPKTFANTQDHTEQLRRCIHDDDLPTDVRAAGILILLYGLRTVDLLSLRREQLIQRGADHYLKIGAAPLLLPPPLVSLLEQLPLHRNNNRTVLQMTGSSSLLLFPGFSNTQPRDAGGFGARLLQHGIDVRRGRNTARLTLAADLPASVLADILSIHNVTATRWARRTRRDWHLYLAQRRTGANAP